MKKALLVLGVLLVLALVAGLVLFSNLGKVVEAAIEGLGPKFTQSTVSVDSVELSPGSGSGTIRGLTVGNPAPYTEPFALKLGEVSVAVDPASLGQDKIIVKSVRVLSPEITLEGGLTENNLQKLLANVQSFTAGEKSQPAEGGGKKLQVDEFVLSGAKVNLKLNLPGIGAAIPPVSLPEIRLSGLGTGADGITPGALTQQVLQEVVSKVIPAVTAQLGDLTKGATDAAKGAVDKAAGALKDATKGLDGLFRKKN
jgi:hypothetical protein